MLFPVLTRKVPSHDFHSLRSSPGWEKARLIWWLPQGQVPRLRPAVMAEGARRPGPNWPSGSSGCPNGRGQVHRLHPMQTATAMRSQRQNWGSRSSLSQGLGLASGWPCEGSRALQDGASSLFPGPSNLPTALRLGELQVPREKARICLYLNLHLHGGPPLTPWTICWMPPWRRERLPTPVFWPGEFHGLYSPWGHRVGHNWATFTFIYIFAKGPSLTVGCMWEGPGANQWLSRTINGHSLTVGCLWEGPTVALTNGWAGPLTVAHWQLVAYGRGPLWHWLMAEQDH